MSGYLTTGQIAERWGCDPSTVRSMARRGLLAGMRLGSDWRFSLAAVEAYEAAHTTSAADETPKQEPPRSTAPSSDRASATTGAAYEPVFAGPVPWRSEVIDAASPAAGRGRSTGKKKAAVPR